MISFDDSSFPTNDTKGWTCNDNQHTASANAPELNSNSGEVSCYKSRARSHHEECYSTVSSIKFIERYIEKH